MPDALMAAKRKAEDTYNAAADAFEAEPLEFWNRFGRRTVQLLKLRPGARVLDVCCGAGASALPAAQAVGRDGEVIGVDLAEDLLQLGRSKAAAAELPWLQFRRGDMTALDFSASSFDVVICVFGIFFVPDMEEQAAKLWRLVKPGGKLAITTWGPDIFAPAYEVWLEAVRRVRPDLCSEFNPWDRITTPESVRRLLVESGVSSAQVTAESGHQLLKSPEDFWTIALGSGLRWTIDQMGADTAAAVRQEVLSRLAAMGLDRVETNAIYAIAER